MPYTIERNIESKSNILRANIFSDASFVKKKGKELKEERKKEHM